MTVARPKRQKKSDRLLSPGATKGEIQCDHALAPFDRAALDMELKWGIDKLPELVSVETADKYGFSVGRLNEAINSADTENVKAWAAVCIRGLHAMDREAEANGSPKARGLYREYHNGDFKFGLLADDREWQTAKDQRPDLKFYTMQDVAVALQAMEGVTLLDEVRQHMPKAKVSKLPKLTDEFHRNGGDDLPF